MKEEQIIECPICSHSLIIGYAKKEASTPYFRRIIKEIQCPHCYNDVSVTIDISYRNKKE